MPTIRPAHLADLDAITDIYNEAILATTASFHLQPRTREQQLRWFESHGPRHPILVAETDGTVVGWASLSPWSDRAAYRLAAETSFYVHSAHRHQGIGRALKQAIITQARRLGFRTLIAQVAQGSHESLHLNQNFGYTHIGTLKQVGHKFGRLLDVHILQLMLDPADARPRGDE